VHAGTSQGSAFVEQFAGHLDAALRELREGFEQLTTLGEHAFASTSIAELYCHEGDDEGVGSGSPSPGSSARRATWRRSPRPT
jgi:hypothetical protein